MKIDHKVKRTVFIILVQLLTLLSISLICDLLSIVLVFPTFMQGLTLLGFLFILNTVRDICTFYYNSKYKS